MTERVVDDERATKYVRELLTETSRCDDHFDYKTLRVNMRKKLGEEVCDRIIDYDQAEKDMQRAGQAVEHYLAWHTRVLVKSLPFRSKVYYYSWHKAENFFALLGIIGAACTSGAFAWRMRRVFR